VGLRVFDLEGWVRQVHWRGILGRCLGYRCWDCRDCLAGALGCAYFYLEEVLGRAVDFFEGLGAGFWH
jgi:hypothetical protein